MNKLLLALIFVATSTTAAAYSRTEVAAGCAVMVFNSASKDPKWKVNFDAATSRMNKAEIEQMKMKYVEYQRQGKELVKEGKEAVFANAMVTRCKASY